MTGKTAVVDIMETCHVRYVHHVRKVWHHIYASILIKRTFIQTLTTQRSCRSSPGSPSLYKGIRYQTRIHRFEQSDVWQIPVQSSALARILLNIQEKFALLGWLASRAHGLAYDTVFPDQTHLCVFLVHFNVQK